MNTNQINKNESPESGLSILPDGRVQVIFKDIDVEALMDLPNDVYSVNMELYDKAGQITDRCKSGMWRIISIASELLPEPNVMAEALEEMQKRKK